MATANQNLSAYDLEKIPDASSMRFGIIASEWNHAITEKLLQGAVETLKRHGAKDENILVEQVPGTFELTFAGEQMAKRKAVDAIILIGCVVQGDTPHFDYVCEGVTQGATALNMKHDIPFIFGVLTTNDLQQAEDRSGGRHGNKGDEAAITAIKMIAFSCRLKK